LDSALLDLARRAPVDAKPQAIRAVGHRVVHGGAELHASVRIDAKVQEAIEQATELAPLHNPPALATILVARRRFARIPQVAVFDNTFFAALPPRAHVYPLPYEWHTDWGIRRFGFHGLSHQYCSERAAELLGRPKDPSLRLVILHLGNGCSASAVVGGKPVATTMGFTPLEGLMMGTRSGSIDPGILIYLEQRRGQDDRALDRALNHASGLLGVSGVSGDLREVTAAAASGNERARLALEIYADRARSAVGSLSVTMGGIDAVVFTAGVGEHAAEMRASICAGLECLGVRIDPERNATASPDADVARSDSMGRILVIHTREDHMIARETLAVLG